MKTWLLIDVSNLAHRAFHTTGPLSFGGEPTGVLFGIFRDVLTLTDRFDTDRMAFFFDSRSHKRREVYPEYKVKRKKLTEDEAEAYRGLYEQLDDLRVLHLPRIGYRNVFQAEGYEADDLIASACEDLSISGQAVIVSTDQDLYQLLREGGVSIWNPVKKRLTTETGFVGEHGIDPRMWAEVKALAGCSGDGVPGVKGVGEKTAIKWINNVLKSGAKSGAIVDFISRGFSERNRRLVELPFAECPEVELVEDSPSVDGWNVVMDELGIEVLMDMRIGQ